MDLDTPLYARAHTRVARACVRERYLPCLCFALDRWTGRTDVTRAGDNHLQHKPFALIACPNDVPHNGASHMSAFRCYFYDLDTRKELRDHPANGKTWTATSGMITGPMESSCLTRAPT